MADSFDSKSFYGSRQKRRIEIKCQIERQLKKQCKLSLPNQFKSRIGGPPASWKIFYKQNEAFQFAQSMSKDLHVFSYEKNVIGDEKGQRMYIVASYPVFWHYYRQLSEEKKHHYEIIAHGSVCKLYFDLEFIKEYNQQCDGYNMVQVFIKYVCYCLDKIYNIKCNTQDVINLDASTEKKFSCHLIFNILNAAFKDNIEVGYFVNNILTELENILKPFDNLSDSGIDLISDDHGESAAATDHPLKQPTTEDLTKESAATTDHPLKQPTTEDLTKESAATTDHPLEQPTTEDLTKESAAATHHPLEQPTTEDLTKESVATTDHLLEQPTTEHLTEKTDTKTVTSNCDNVIHKTKTMPLQDQTPQERQTLHKSTNIVDNILNIFPIEDLRSLLVNNKHDQNVFFVDRGVYTKNRNFRLYLSSKLGKQNPLLLSRDNIYKDKTSTNDNEELVFFTSLISNVTYTDKMKILYSNEKEIKKDTSIYNNTSKQTESDSIEGDQCSPYPEIDSFIYKCINNNDTRNGVIRRWTYFTNGELLIYDIAKYRWCENINRQHKSNNIMLVVDIKRGVYYQKCHDPQCQGFKSDDHAIPVECLPCYLIQQDDDILPSDEDEDLLQAVDEIETTINNSRHNVTFDSDFSDNELLHYTDELEKSLCEN